MRGVTGLIVCIVKIIIATFLRGYLITKEQLNLLPKGMN